MTDPTREAARPIVAMESRVTGREVVEVSYSYDELLAIFDGDDNVVRPLVLRCRELEAALAAARAEGRVEGQQAQRVIELFGSYLDINAHSHVIDPRVYAAWDQVRQKAREEALAAAAGVEKETT